MEQTNFQTALKELRKLEELLQKQNKADIAAIIRSQILKLEIIGNTYLKDLGELENTQTKHNRMFFVIVSVWKKRYPEYGEPSAQDRAAVEELIRTFLTPVYPNAGDIFIERKLDNFARSNDTWIEKNRTLAIFCRHFRKFIDGPVRRQQQAVTRSDGF